MTGEIESNKKLCWKVSDADEISIHEWKHRCKPRCYFSIIPTKLKLHILTMKVFMIRFPTSILLSHILKFDEITNSTWSNKWQRTNNWSKRRLFEICFKWLIIQTQLFKLVYITILKRRLKKQLTRKSIIIDNKHKQISTKNRRKFSNEEYWFSINTKNIWRKMQRNSKWLSRLNSFSFIEKIHDVTARIEWEFFLCKHSQRLKFVSALSRQI